MNAKTLVATALVGLMAVAAHAAVINDGTTTANLTQEVNVVDTANYPDGIHVVNISSDGSVLSASAFEDADGDTSNGYDTMDDNSAKAAWTSTAVTVNTNTYSTSADFKPAGDNGRHRGGVIGWFDDSTREGISLYVKPGSSFRIRTMKFNEALDANNEDTGDYLYKTDGTKKGGSGFDFGMSGYDVDDWATFELAFSDADPLDGFTDVVATVTQGNNVWSQAFKTDLAQPAEANHRVGYFGYAGTSPGDDVGSFDNLSYVPEPASLALLGLGGLAVLRRRRV